MTTFVGRGVVDGEDDTKPSLTPKNPAPCLRLASLLVRGRLRTIGGYRGLSFRGLGLGAGRGTCCTADLTDRERAAEWTVRIVSMNSVTLENFRCFGEKQTVRLAPLTLLVGENSTGKTSFLALIRALWDMAYTSRVPDFRESPWDLGSFNEIAHHRGARGGRSSAIDAGFTLNADRVRKGVSNEFRFTLAKDRTAPAPVSRYRSRGENWISETLAPTKPYSLDVGTSRGEWRMRDTDEFPVARDGFIAQHAWFILSNHSRFDTAEFDPANGSPPMTKQDFAKVRRVSELHASIRSMRPFAGAPVRSEPLRTYDPSRIYVDPEGDYVPVHLAEVKASDPDSWQYLKRGLERFGGSAGLFDEIDIKQFGDFGGPFQIRVKKHDGRYKGPWRNIVDVGYGVSQALPVLTELVRPDSPDMFLLQQPEVHLHPMAQAALGSLFCQVAGSNSPRRQIIVETHSDHLINRVRMDVRDEVTDLRPEDVMVLYFERDGLDVKIHEVTFDYLGNVDAPASYGRFFMEEMNRNLWPEDYVPVR